MFAKVFDSFHPSRLHNWGPQGLWGTRELAILLLGKWEYEYTFQENSGTKWILGNNMEVLLREQSKKFWELGRIWKFFKGTQEHRPPWGTSQLYL